MRTHERFYALKKRTLNELEIINQLEELSWFNEVNLVSHFMKGLTSQIIDRWQKEIPGNYHESAERLTETIMEVMHERDWKNKEEIK